MAIGLIPAMDHDRLVDIWIANPNMFPSAALAQLWPSM